MKIITKSIDYALLDEEVQKLITEKLTVPKRMKSVKGTILSRKKVNNVPTVRVLVEIDFELKDEAYSVKEDIVVGVEYTKDDGIEKYEVKMRKAVKEVKG